MKKYVKPLMESEAFVANEYVSACWTLHCDKCGDEPVKGDSLNDVSGLKSERIPMTGVTVYYYTNQIEGSNPCVTEEYSTIPKPSWWGNDDFSNWVWGLVLDFLGARVKEEYHLVDIKYGQLDSTDWFRPNASI